MSTQPLVSIVTPVFNGERFLEECIESVLAQTYDNWEYTIVNNCSTDRSLEIAEHYSRQDRRVRVRSNTSFAGLIENHNIAFRAASQDSRYCKLVSADDWLYPECVAKLVQLAETDSSIGVVGSYSINKKGIKWSALPPDKSAFPGRQIARDFLLGLIDSFWVPSTVLYRSSLVRSEHAFFPGSAPSADLSACLRCLESTDFGFVHQVLSFERIHTDSDTTRVRREGSYLLDRIDVLREFGQKFLDASEYEARLDAILDEYYQNVLAPAFFDARSKEFWQLHRKRLQQLGYPFYGARLTRAVGSKLLDLVFNPKQTVEKIFDRTKRLSPKPPC